MSKDSDAETDRPGAPKVPEQSEPGTTTRRIGKFDDGPAESELIETTTEPVGSFADVDEADGER